VITGVVICAIAVFARADFSTPAGGMLTAGYVLLVIVHALRRVGLVLSHCVGCHAARSPLVCLDGRDPRGG
jgi:hypothetical protein